MPLAATYIQTLVRMSPDSFCVAANSQPEWLKAIG
jgi:hypothetical protein